MPSTGSAETGRLSPSSSSITEVTSRTKAGAWSGTGGIIPTSEAGSSGTSTRCRWATAASTAASFLATTSAPRRPYVLRIDFLTSSMAASRGMTLLIAKKHVWRTVLVRLPMPAVRATELASTVHSSQLNSIRRSCMRRGRRPNSSSGG